LIALVLDSLLVLELLSGRDGFAEIPNGAKFAQAKSRWTLECSYMTAKARLAVWFSSFVLLFAALKAQN
jgi:hypothetical protein